VISVSPNPIIRDEPINFISHPGNPPCGRVGHPSYCPCSDRCRPSSPVDRGRRAGIVLGDKPVGREGLSRGIWGKCAITTIQALGLLLDSNRHFLVTCELRTEEKSTKRERWTTQAVIFASYVRCLAIDVGSSAFVFIHSRRRSQTRRYKTPQGSRISEFAMSSIVLRLCAR